MRWKAQGFRSSRLCLRCSRGLPPSAAGYTYHPLTHTHHPLVHSHTLHHTPPRPGWGEGGVQSLIHPAFSESLPHPDTVLKIRDMTRGKKKEILNQCWVGEELDGKERMKLYMVWEVSSVLRKSKADGEDRESWDWSLCESLSMT